MIPHSVVRDALNDYLGRNRDVFIGIFTRESIEQLFYNKDLTDAIFMKNYLLVFSKLVQEDIDTFVTNSENRHFIVTVYIDIIDEILEQTEDKHIIGKLYEDIEINLSMLKETLNEDESIALNLKTDLVESKKDLNMQVSFIMYMIMKYVYNDFIELMKEYND